MKVAFVTIEYPPYGAGIATYSYYLSHKLRELGVDITLFVPKYVKQVSDISLPFQEVRVVRLPLLSLLSFSLALREVSFKDYELIHCNDMVGAFINADCSTAHHLSKLQVPIYSCIPIRAFDSHILSRYERRAFSRSRKVIAVSNYTKRTLIEDGIRPDKIEVIPPGVDTDRFKPREKSSLRELLGLPQDKVILCYVGRLEYHKNVQLIISSIESINDVFLIIIGRGNYEFPLKKLVRKKGVPQKVRFLGYVSEEMLPLYYSACDIFVSVSMLEGFGMTLAEAMASGVAVISANATAAQELIIDGKNGYLMDPKSVSQLRDKIEFLKNSDSVRGFLGRNARKTAVQKLGWDTVASKTIDLYNSLVNSR